MQPSTISPLSHLKNRNKMPLRTVITVAIIFLSTFQIYIVLNSPIFLRNKLVRQFLSTYYYTQDYPQLYDGLSYQVKLQTITELKDHLCFIFQSINKIDNTTFSSISYDQAKINLIIQYNRDNADQKQSIFQINPQVGIVYPFNMNDKLSIQHFLMKIQLFQLEILNVKLNTDGFAQKYKHNLQYQYEDQIFIRNNFDFSIDFSDVTFDQPQRTHGIYIKIYFMLMLLVSVFALYLNYRQIIKVYNYLYYSLGLNNSISEQQVSQAQQIKLKIQNWIKQNKLKPNEVTFFLHFKILQFDIIFSTLSNITQIIASCYLIVGAQQQLLLGVACMFSWLTVFRVIREQKKLVLMYQLIKLSFFRIMLFFVEFLPVFISYIFLGICLFPKVSYFGSVDDSATTLISMMAGDSIKMISSAIIQKNSSVICILYVFSFVVLFMHAIHNTLVSLIKQAFILKKIQLVMYQKQKNHQEEYIYIEETKTELDIKKNALPIKMTPQFEKEVIRNTIIKKMSRRRQKITNIFSVLENIIFQEIQLLADLKIQNCKQYKEELIRRLIKVKQMLQSEKSHKKQSVLTEE